MLCSGKITLSHQVPPNVLLSYCVLYTGLVWCDVNGRNVSTCRGFDMPRLIYLNGMQWAGLLLTYLHLREMMKHGVRDLSQASTMFNIWHEWTWGCEGLKYNTFSGLYCCLMTSLTSFWKKTFSKLHKTVLWVVKITCRTFCKDCLSLTASFSSALYSIWRLTWLRSMQK